MEPMNKKQNDNDVDIDSLLAYYKSDDSKQKSNLSANTRRADNKAKAEPLSSSAVKGVNASQDSRQPQQKKKFVVRIDDDEYNYSGSSSANSSQKPADNSSIYFSNYKGRNARVTTNSSNYSRPATSSQHRPTSSSPAKKTTGKKKVGKNIKTVGGRFATVLFACIILFTSIASYLSITTINDILAITESDDSIEVRVYKHNSKGEEDLTDDLSYSEIIDILADNNLVSRKQVCKLFAKFRHFDNEAYKFKPGVYTFKKSMGVEGMLYKCLQQNKTAETVTVSFPEGWTITQMFEKLEKNKVCTAKSLYAVLDAYMETHSDDYDFLKNVPQDEKRYQVFEGYLFPDTYDFYVESDPNFVIDKLFNSFNSHWNPECQAQAQKLGYTMDQIMIIASIIQKEAANSSQMKDVSSVLHNRLKNSVNYPSIGCDSTYDYISNYFDAANFAVSQKAYYISVYKTDTNRGLPPGPICNPGLDAIEAALFPTSTNYYFFQHDKFGKIYLAGTKSQFDYDYSVVQRVNNSD